MGFTSGSPGAGQLEIGIALVLQDRFSNQAREASSQIRKLHMDAKNAVNANLMAMQGAAGSGMTIAKTMGSKIGSMVEEGASFIDTMTTVGAISRASNKDLKGLTTTAQTIGLKTMFDSQDIASGMMYLARAGNDVERINKMINGAAMVANATGMELGGKGGSADMISNVMHTFKLEAGEAANVVGDQLAMAALSSNMSMQDMAESIKYAGSNTRMLKQSLPSLIAMIGTLGNAGIQGSMAGTSIDNMLRYLTKSITNPKFKGSDALARVGLSKADFLDANGDILNMGISLEKLKKATAGLSSVESQSVFIDLFGVRGVRAAVMLMQDLDKYKEILDKVVNNSAGFAEEVVQKRMATFAGALDTMKNSFENFRTTFATAIGPVLIPIFKVVTAIMSGIRAVFNIPILGTFLSSLTAISVALLGIGSALLYLRTKWLIFRNDSQVTTSSWFGILKGGWNACTIKAERYLAIQNAIIAQQKAGVMGSGAYGAMMANMGNWTGNAKATQGKKNPKQMYYWVRGADGKVKRTTAEKAASTISPKDIGNMAKGSDPITSPPIAANMKGAMGQGFKGALGGLTKVGGKLLGFLMGPWGIALSAASIAIPALVSAFKDNTDESNENTASIIELKRMMGMDLQERLSSKDANEFMLSQQIQALTQTLQYWASRIDGKMGNKPAMVLNASIDGKPLKGMIVDEINNYNNNSNFNNNLK